MSVEYSIEPFGPEVEEAYGRLFPGDQDKRAIILKWRFTENPHGEGRFVVARHEGRIHGLIALVPTRLVAGSSVVSGWQAIDTIVDPELRGKFLFMRLGKLAEKFVAERDGVLWGFPNASAARGWFGRLGWTRSGSAPFLIKPLRSGYLFGRVIPILARLNFRLYSRPRKRLSERSSANVGAWPELSASSMTGVDRDRDWIKWRLDKPGAGYRIFSDGSGQFAIIRIEQKHGGNIAYLMEAQGADQGKLRLLIRDALAWAGDEGADVALAWCAPESPNYRSHRQAGFLPFVERLRPIEIHHGYWVAPTGPVDPCSLDCWYLSYLDSDTV